MSLRVEQECPQCGGSLDLAETDRLLRCGFCSVQSFLGNSGPLHFILPRRQPDPYSIYAPYLRFKGAVYSCLTDRLVHRLTDITLRGLDLPFLPLSLGLRPQAMKMHLAAPTFPGSFLKKSLPIDKILARAAKNPALRGEQLLDQTYIGEALNIIYLPLSLKNQEIFDGVQENTLAAIPENAAPFEEAEIENHPWKPVFLPALCPQCGWNLEGEPDSVVLFCANCNSGWQAGDRGFAGVKVRVTPASAEGELYLPFWNFRVAAKAVKLSSFADFIRFTNQALVIRPEWEEKPLYLVIPAFKVRPRDFLRLATQMSLSRRHSLPTADTIPVKQLHPATLAADDAGQGLKVILANSAVSRNLVFPLLPQIEFEIKEYFLHYLPFAGTSHELCRPDLGITINRRVLDYGRGL